MRLQRTSDERGPAGVSRWSSSIGVAGLLWAVSACQAENAAEARVENVSVSKEAAQPAAAEAPAPAPATNGANEAEEAPGAEAEESQGAGAAPAPGVPPSSKAAAETAPGRNAATPTAAAAKDTAPAEAPAKNAKAELKQGAVVSEEPFSTWLEASSPLPVGAASNVDVVLIAKAPYHTNAEYPHKFKLGPAPAGLRYPEQVVKGMQVQPERGVLRVPVHAERPGPATITGTLSFSVCTEERCLVEKRELSLNLDAR